MGRRAVIIGCGLLLGLLLDTNRSFPQTAEVLYHGCVETTIDRNGDGVFDELQDETFEQHQVYVIVGLPPISTEEDFNLSAFPLVRPDQSRDPMPGDIFVYSAQQVGEVPQPLTCQAISNPLVYWSLRRLQGDSTPCGEIFGTRLPSVDLNAIPIDFELTGFIGSNACGILTNNHFGEDCAVNIVRSTVPRIDMVTVFDLAIEVDSILYGHIGLFPEDLATDPTQRGDVDLVIEGTAPDGSGGSPMFRSEIHATRAFAGEEPQCEP
jgi:hypothetical protein